MQQHACYNGFPPLPDREAIVDACSTILRRFVGVWCGSCFRSRIFMTAKP